MVIYLDNAATTKPCDAAIKALNECLTENFGNPSSLHTLGLNAQKTVEKSRRSIASALGCDTSEVTFTSCATESTNTVLKGAALKYGKRKKKIITSSVEHSSVRECMKYLSENGFEIVYISPRKDGTFYAEDFINAADENTCLVSMMLVNNENGCILPVGKTFKALKRKYPEIICHCDAVQGFMKIPVKIRELSCDLLSLSAHKIYAPKGTGVMYIKKGIIIHPLLLGGGQENKQRSGTESVPLIAAFGAAVDFLAPIMKNNLEHYEKLRNHLTEKLSENENIKINYDKGVPYIMSISVKGIRSEIMLHTLEKSEIYVSSGSACSKGKSSGVLEEFGADALTADSTLRLSFSYETTTEMLDIFAEKLFEAQRTLSSVINKK